jgi:hypothetical protein
LDLDMDMDMDLRFGFLVLVLSFLLFFNIQHSEQAQCTAAQQTAAHRSCATGYWPCHMGISHCVATVTYLPTYRYLHNITHNTAQ